MTHEKRDNSGALDAAPAFPKESPSPSLPASKAGEEEWAVELGYGPEYFVVNKKGEAIVNTPSQWIAKKVVAAHNASLSGLTEADVTADQAAKNK